MAHWVSQGSTMLHDGGLSRHLLLTVPARLRTTFSHNAVGLWSAGRRCGVPCLDAFESQGRGKALQGGSMAVLHTHGRHGQNPPPLPVSARGGG